MSGSSIGEIFKITTWGESHGKAVGVVVDGCPAGIFLNEEDIQKMLDRRKPGVGKFTTKRNEEDKIEILSGVFENKTTGTPISMMVYNKDQHSKDYSEIKNYYRPGHADYTFDMKYGFRDYRGGGRSSGRETVGRVAGGAVALKVLEQLGIKILTYTKSIGNIEIDEKNFDEKEIFNNDLYMPDKEAYLNAKNFLEQSMKEKNSAGGVVECIIKGVKPGIGEPVFNKLDSNLSKAIFSIGGVKGFEIGRGFEVTKLKGSESNDNFYFSEENQLKKFTNNSGGILGGISDGFDIIFRAHFKPTPSIGKNQKTINNNNENIEIQIEGRHDPIIVPRGIVVVESMAAITILDLILMNLTSNIEIIKKLLD